MNPVINMNHASRPEPEYTPPSTDELRALEISSLSQSIDAWEKWQLLHPSESVADLIRRLQRQLAELTDPADECSCAELPDGRGTTCTMCAAKAAAEEMPY